MRMVEHTQVNIHNPLHKQTQEQKLYNNFTSTEKFFNKIQHPFLIKVLEKQVVRGHASI